MPRLPFLALLAAFTACAERVTPTVQDASLDAARDATTVVDVPADARPDVPRDRPPPGIPDAFSTLRDAPAGDVDPACAAGALDRCPTSVPGPCADLSDGRERVVSFAGFRQDHAPSCAGAMTSAGPDAVLPLIITQTSDVNIAAAPGPSDAVVVALHAADQCGDARQEILCVNGSSAIGAIATARASSLPPGRYTITVATARGLDVRLQTQVTAARPRLPGEALHRLGLPRVVGVQHLDRQALAHAQVLDLVHGAHAALTQEADHPVARVDLRVWVDHSGASFSYTARDTRPGNSWGSSHRSASSTSRSAGWT
jgi:hypothetical protein